MNISKDKAYLWHPYSSLVNPTENITISSAKGVYLITDKGEKIIDAISSWWVNIHGHTNTYINECIAKQVGTLEHVLFAGFTHQPAIDLAERLLAILPGDQKKLFLSDNGSTAVEVALKMAIQYRKNKGDNRSKLIALEGAFHGDTFGAMSVSERGLFTNHFSPYLFDVEFIPFPTSENEHTVLDKFETLVKKGDVSAFIYEPLIQGASGMRPYHPSILEKLVALAKKEDVLCIADEVMTGFGRTGPLFASEYLLEKPDIICLSKGITGGYMPMGATACNEKIEQAFLDKDPGKTFFHGHSYTGNPLACAIANASLDLLLTESCKNNRARINAAHVGFMRKIDHLPSISSVKVLGTILTIEIRCYDGEGYMSPIRDELYAYFLSKNILLRPLGNVIYLIPPYVINNQELETIYQAISELLINRVNYF